MSFRITTRDGSTLRTVDHFESALSDMKGMPLAAMVVRDADGVILAFRTIPKKKAGDA